MGRQLTAPPAVVTPSSVSKISQQGSTQDLGGFPLHVEPFDLSLGNRMGRQMTAPAVMHGPSSAPTILGEGDAKDLGRFPITVDPCGRGVSKNTTAPSRQMSASQEFERMFGSAGPALLQMSTAVLDRATEPLLK